MATTYFIDFATGSDSNSGMTKSGPWKRCPGMTGFAGSYGHQTGDNFIFKGGVTWTAGCWPLTIASGGTVSTPDVYGTDPTWGTGLAVFDFENTGGDNSGVSINASNITFGSGMDLKRHRARAGSFAVSTVRSFGSFTGIRITNCIIRDWSLATPVPNGTGQSGGAVFAGGAVVNVDNCTIHQRNAGMASGEALYGVSIITFCEIDHTSTAIHGPGIVHDVHIHDLIDNIDPTSHNAAIVTFNPVTLYNLLIHDLTGTHGPIELFGQTNSTVSNSTDLIYNVVMYNCGVQPCIWIGNDSNLYNTHTVKIYNSTLNGGGGACFSNRASTGAALGTLDLRNNHFITTGNPVNIFDPSQLGGPVTNLTNDHNLVQTPAQAAAAGYTPANNYAPTGAGAPTVNGQGLSTPPGVNLSSIFATDRLGATRTAPWDVGAYEFNGAVSPSDTTLPVVTLTAPAAGASLSGTVNVSANASDNVGVTAVTFYVDNSPVATVNAAPYAASIDTSTLTNGAHTIRADARDAAGNVGSSSVSVTVANGSTGGGGSGPNLLANPGFEVGPFDTAGTVSGWVVVGRVKDSNEAGAAGGTGRAAQFGYGGNFQGNSLSQDIPTTSGQQYTVAFDSGVFGQPTSPITLRVQVIGAGATSLLDQTVAPTANNTFNTATVPFSRYTFHFTANGSTATLRFTDIGTGNASADLLVDNASVTADTPAPGPAILSVSTNSCDWGYVAEGDTPLDKDVVLKNTGASNMTGTASGASGNFSVVGTASYDLDPDEEVTITLRYRPTVKGIHTATLNLTGGGGGSVALRGACYPVAGSLTGIQAEDALIVAPFAAASGLVSQSIETTDPRFGGLLVIGFVIVTPGQYTVACSVSAPSESANSFFVEEGAEPTDPADVWDIGVTIGTQVRTVGARGTGTLNDPQFPVRVFDWSSGRKFLVIRGREAGAAIDSLSIAVVAPPPAPPVTPSSPSPADSATGVSTTLAALTWTGDGTTYDFKFGTSATPSLIATGLASASFPIAAPLANSTDYFWQVVARGPGGVTTGPVWKFTTAAPPPSPPANPVPTNAATDVSLTPSLRWESSATPFSVKLDTVNPPVQVAGSGIVPAQLDISTKLAPSTVYYWQVNAGPIWSFTTVAVAPPRKIPAIIIVRRA